MKQLYEKNVNFHSTGKRLFFNDVESTTYLLTLEKLMAVMYTGFRSDMETKETAEISAM